MAKKKICIIKFGALGDVLRTTPILRVLKADIFWITAKKAIPLLVNNHLITRAIESTNIPKKYLSLTYDLVVNLEESLEACKIASLLKTKKYIGVFYNKKNNKFDYTKESAPWFDMSLVSRFGKREADKLKRSNQFSYQHFLFQMFGEQFKNEPYILNTQIKNYGLIGLEPRVGEIWPNKAWKNFKELEKRLKKLSYRTLVLRKRKKLSNYIKDIGKCSLIVSGDTLAMHIGLALKRKVIAFFGPTSATEICDYNCLTKIITPFTCHGCYKRKCLKKPNCLEVISVDLVLEKIVKALNNND